MAMHELVTDERDSNDSQVVIEYLAKNCIKRVVEDLKDPIMFEEIERKKKFKFICEETGRDEGTQIRNKVRAYVCVVPVCV